MGGVRNLLRERESVPNAFTEVEVDVVFKQGEKQWKVPAFWAGDKKWTVRFAPPAQGKYTYRVECTDKANTGPQRERADPLGHGLQGRQPAAEAWLCAGVARQDALRARRRHAVLLAGRHLVEDACASA